MLGDGAARSERFAGVDGQRELPGHELITPSALDLGAIGESELFSQQLQALPEREGLLGRPVRRGHERGGRSRRACWTSPDYEPVAGTENIFWKFGRH